MFEHMHLYVRTLDSRVACLYNHGYFCSKRLLLSLYLLQQFSSLIPRLIRALE